MNANATGAAKGASYVPLLGVLYAATFLAGFNENLVNMGLMSIMGEYGVDSVTAQWLVTGYMIASTVVVMCMAFFYRRFELRKLFFAGAVLCVVGSAMGLFSMNFGFLLVARLIQAVGAGMFIPMMMNTILVVTPRNKLGTFMSIGGCMISFGPAFAPVVCGCLVTAFGWHSVFVVPLVGMVVIALLGMVFLRNLGTSEIHLDVPSACLSAVFLFTLSFGLAQVMAQPVVGIASLAVAIASAVVFVVRQTRCAFPLIDVTPMKSIRFWPATVLVVVAMMIMFSLSVLLPLYFEGALGMSAFMAGLVILVPVLVNTGFTLVAGRIMDKRGEWPLLPAGFALGALGTAAMAIVAPSQSAPALFVAALFVYAGIGLVFSPSQTAGLKTLPPQQNPFGVALMTTFVQVAACVGPALFTGVLSSVQGGAIAGGADAGLGCALGFAAAIEVAAVIAFVGLAVAFVYSLAAHRRAAQAPAVAGAGVAGVPAGHGPQGGAPAGEAAVPAACALACERMADEPGRAVEAAQAGAAVREHTAGEFGRAAQVGAAASLSSATLADIMEREPYAVAADAPVSEAMHALVEHQVSGLPLVDAQGHVCGFVSDGDIMRYLADKTPAFTSSYVFLEAANNQSIDERLHELMVLPVAEIATDKVVSLPASTTLKDACQTLAQHKFKKAPVVDEAGRMVGVVSRSSILRRAMESYLEK